jgi:hypothetical protein
MKGKVGKNILRKKIVGYLLFFNRSNAQIITCFIGCHDTQHNDTQHNDSQHNDTHHNDTQRNDTQHNDTQHNDTKHNDTQQNDTQHNDTQNNDNQNIDTQNNDNQNIDTQHNDSFVMLGVTITPFILSVIMLSVKAKPYRIDISTLVTGSFSKLKK